MDPSRTVSVLLILQVCIVALSAQICDCSVHYQLEYNLALSAGRVSSTVTFWLTSNVSH
jgi:hypothetical protein